MLRKISLTTFFTIHRHLQILSVCRFTKSQLNLLIFVMHNCINFVCWFWSGERRSGRKIESRARQKVSRWGKVLNKMFYCIKRIFSLEITIGNKNMRYQNGYEYVSIIIHIVCCTIQINIKTKTRRNKINIISQTLFEDDKF